MDGTFGGGDLISASLAIMLSGTDAELHDKEVALTTSDVTGSQTAVFEYDPQNEPVSGDPPGPWDGYSLFTIDLSGVKDDIEALQEQLQACHDCKDDVIAAIRQYVPDYVLPASGCPDDGIPDVYDAGYDAGEASVTLGSKFITANGTYLPASDNLDGYNQVVVDVPTWESCIQTIAAKLGVQEPYDCQDIVDAIDKQKGVTVPDGVDPAPIALELNGAVTDNDIHASVQIVCRVNSSPDVYVPLTKITRPPYNVFMPFAKVTYIEDGEQITDYFPLTGSYGLNTDGDYGEITSWSVASADGTITANGVWHTISAGGTFDIPVTGSITISQLVGWGDTGHTQRITN